MIQNIWDSRLNVSAFLFLILFSCNREDEQLNSDDENINVLTGIVLDQVSRQPVSGADIYYGYLNICEFEADVIKIGPKDLSDDKGIYNLKVSKSICEDQFRYPCQVIYASKNGYIGSNIIGPSTNGTILLYHSSELQLHIFNDTINNTVDTTNLWITNNNINFHPYPGFFGRVLNPGLKPAFELKCRERNFDTILVINKLWGGLEYEINAGEAFWRQDQFLFKSSFLAKPDSTTYYTVSF
jgi:hypothetical protein